MPQFIKSPTEHQKAIFSHIVTEEKNGIVDAVAGSGKTSTIIHGMGLLECDSVVYLVFNKKNQVEAQTRLKGTKVQAYTFNAYGMKALPRTKWSVNGDKAWDVWRVLRDEIRLSKEDDRLYGSFAVKMISLARSAAIGISCPDEPEVWMELAEHHDHYPQGDLAEMERAIELSRKLLARMIEVARTHNEIDFDEMLYLPLLADFGGKIPRPKWIFVDEAQDLSPVQVEFVARMMGAKPGQPIPANSSQRCMFVGDPWQAIYGWRGADCDAMDNIQIRFRCARLPLSVCFRCGSDFVNLAASLGAPIEPAPGKATGTLKTWTAEDGSYRVREGIVVLCRTTAPLVTNAYKLIKQGRKAIVLGREIGKGLITLIKQQKADDLVTLRDNLQKWSFREIERLEGKEHKQEAIRDKVDCILVLAEMLPVGQDIDHLITRIEGLFTDSSDNRGITFCTVHKSKGLEWDEVVILDAHKMPAAWAKKDWQRKQEVHVAYVAYTRAREVLTLVPAEFFEADDLDRKSQERAHAGAREVLTGSV